MEPIDHPVSHYATGVVEGDIVAGELVRMTTDKLGRLCRGTSQEWTMRHDRPETAMLTFAERVANWEVAD